MSNPEEKSPELFALLPSFESMVNEEAVLPVVARAVELRRESRSITQAITSSLESHDQRQIGNISEFGREAVMRRERADGIIEALDAIVPRSDGESWDLLAEDMPENPQASQEP